MKYITIKETEYIANLDTKAIIEAESRLGTSLLTLMAKVADDELPQLKDLLVIFQESLRRYNHGIDWDKTMDIYSDYISDGHTFPEFITLMIDIMRDGGLLPDNNEEEEDSKN